MKKWKKIVLISVIILVAGAFTFAKVGRIAPLLWEHNTVNQPMFSDQAINGYDPVAYFTESKAVAGNETISHFWNEATWNFSSKRK
jgi:hypothetical protein